MLQTSGRYSFASAANGQLRSRMWALVRDGS